MEVEKKTQERPEAAGAQNPPLAGTQKENADGTAKKEKPVKRTMIGGQALMEGVMMRGRTSMAMAVRGPDGSVMLETQRLKGPRWYNRVPLVRGVVSFVMSLVTGVGTLTRSAEISTPDEETPGKGAMAFAVVLGVVLAVGLFMALPWLIDWLLFDLALNLDSHFSGGTAALLHELIKGLIRVLIFVLYLFLVSRMRDIRRTFMYHGAEHRTINCFEHGYDMTVENVQKCSTRHNRCGTTFLFFVMVVSILVLAFVSWGLSLLGLTNKLLVMLVRIAFIPVVAGISYELLRGLALLPDNWFTNALRAPGLALQRLTTYPPEDDMAEVAIKSFLAVYDMDADPSIGEQKFGEYFLTVTRKAAVIQLKNAGLGEREAEAEADWILCEVLGCRRADLFATKKLNYGQYKRLNGILARRETGEPLDYIIGKSEFFGRPLKVTCDVLIPRMETEVLTEEAVRLIGDGEPEVLDLCAGSGCIALALAKSTNARITAADLSDKAVAVARENLKDTGVTTVVSDLFASIGGCYDLIVCNPPYIPSNEIVLLSPEVRAQSALALDGGADGLDFYRRISAAAPEFLKRSGTLALEIGFDQARAVTQILADGGFDPEKIRVLRDLDGNERVVTAQKGA